MDSVIGTAACERVCSGTWDLLCFIEHLCVTSVLKFILAVILAHFVLYACYLLCKLGVVKCLAKNACKLAYMPCWGGCRLLRHLWRKVRDTERVYRGRRGRRRQPDDIELGNGDLSTSSYDDYRGSSSSPSDYSGHHRGGAAAGRSSRWESLSAVRGRRKDRIRQSLRPRRAGSKVEHAVRVKVSAGTPIPSSPFDRDQEEGGFVSPRPWFGGSSRPFACAPPQMKSSTMSIRRNIGSI